MESNGEAQGRQPTAPLTVPASLVADIDDKYHDQDKDDPNLVDDVLSQELMKLSVQQRTKFQEEVHGVRCLAPKETPELLQQSLDMLQWEIDNAIPVRQKCAYLKSQNLPGTYVNTKEFRLRFLRCELFDPRSAAVRMTKFLDHVLDLFGSYALKRPIRLSDFSKAELKYVRKGRFQLLPYRDRGGTAGRRVLCVFPDAEWEQFPLIMRSKLMMFFTWTAGNDIDVQKEGLVFLVWFDETANVSAHPAIQAKDHELATVRACAIHCCSPDTPFYRIRRSFVIMRIGRHNRPRLIVHLGNSVEIRYKLQSYGILSEQIPITYAGKVKTVYLKQWLKVREYKESLILDGEIRPPPFPIANQKIQRDDSITTSCSLSETSDCEIDSNHIRIESPFLSDIIFRKGTSLVFHPGNTNLRTIIVAKAQQELLLAQQEKMQKQKQQSKQHQTRRFVSEIIQEVRETSLAKEVAGTGKACRFLVWNEGGWWTELSQEYEIHTRIEYIVRGIRNTVVKNHKALSGTTTPAPTTASESIATSTTGTPPPANFNGRDGEIEHAIENATATSRKRKMKKKEPPRAEGVNHHRQVSGSDTSSLASSTATSSYNNNNNNNNNNNHDYQRRESEKSLTSIAAPAASDSALKKEISAPSVISCLTKTQEQNGGTDIFRLQDPFGPGVFFLPHHKKPRIFQNGDSLSESDNSVVTDVRMRMDGEAECFGMTFNSTNLWSEN